MSKKKITINPINLALCAYGEFIVESCDLAEAMGGEEKHGEAVYGMAQDLVSRAWAATQDAGLSSRATQARIDALWRAFLAGQEIGEKLAESDCASEKRRETMSNGVQLSKKVVDTLARRRLLMERVRSEGDSVDDRVYAELRATLPDMVKTFLPLVTQLIEAGLLTTSMDIASIDDLHRFSTLDGEPTVAFDNGNIWIEAEFGGGCLRDKNDLGPVPESGQREKAN